jgi:hypothetical protein
MSRWSEAFAALSAGDGTLDTVRQSNGLNSKVSQSVNTVLPLASTPSLLSSVMPLDCGGDGWNDGEHERAAIVEHDGAICQAWAEAFARLNPDTPPGDVSPFRWQQFVDDVGRFLDSRLCIVAVALGWGPHDLFGCDTDRSARIDRPGLLWLLNGNKLIALSENTATIETRNGERHTWRRRPTDPGQVLAWELMR